MTSQGSEASGRRLAAILFTDLVGSTALMAESEEAGLRAKRRHRELVRERVSRYRGEFIEAPGDETLSIFGSALDAVNCALAIEGALASESFALHMGIHSGDVLVQGGEVLGDGVNIAARVCELSEGGGICISGEVYQAIRNQPGIEARSLGERELRNVGRPVAVYWIGRGVAAQVPSRASLTGRRSRLPVFAASGALIVVLLGLAGWWLLPTAADADPIRSIAVLPLENLTSGEDSRALAVGLTDALIGELARRSSLRVTSLRSVMSMDTRRPLREIASELGVDAVVAGTLLQSGGRVQITANLVDARSDQILWSDRFEQETGDLIGLVSEIAESAASGIQAELEPSSGRQVDPDAQRAYLRGRSEFADFSYDSLQRALVLFEEAIGRDSEFAAAHVAKAQTQLVLQWGFDHEPALKAYPEVRESALAALELEPGLADAHAVLGMVHMVYDWEWGAAERELRRAVEIGGADPFLESQYAMYLASMARRSEAEAALERTLQRAPNELAIQMYRMWLYVFLRDFGRALEEGEALLPDYPDSPVVLNVVATLLEYLGRWDEAVPLWYRLFRAQGASEESIADYETTYREGGVEAVLREQIRSIEANGPLTRSMPLVNRARTYAQAGELDKAFEHLDRAIEARESQLVVFLRGPYFPPEFERDPRFQEYLERVGLPPLPAEVSVTEGEMS